MNGTTMTARISAAVNNPVPNGAPENNTPTPGTSKGTCPVIDEALLLCLRFEGNLLDEAPPPTLISGGAAGYEPGTDVFIALDPATSEVFENGAYVL